MATFKKQKIVNATQEEVWSTLSNYGDIYKFNPGVKKSYITSDKNQGIGATRICELLPVGKVSETIKEWDENHGFLLKVAPLEKLPPIEKFTTHFKIEKLSVNTSRVSVTVNYSMKLGVTGKILNKILIQPKLEGSIEDLLSGLKAHIEKDVLITDTKSLKDILKSV